MRGEGTAWARAEARALFLEGYRHQTCGHLVRAAACYRRSLAAHPTPEAHTFLGATKRHRGDIRGAIRECRKAIALDPTFGNSWNDLGAYLVEMGEIDAAVPFLRQACRATRFVFHHCAHYNLARAFRRKGLLMQALRELRLALALEPRDRLARRALVAALRGWN